MYQSKQEILKAFPELELTQFGDFKIKQRLIKDYDIIDFHCHLFDGVQSFVPKVFRKRQIDYKASFFDLSCYPIDLKYFDFNQELFTTYPDKMLSPGGLKLAYELSGLGGFINAIRKSTPERMLRDMKLNNVSKALVLQLNTPNCDSGPAMEKICQKHEVLMTFGCIHPHEDNIETKIKENLQRNIKGWKIAPHVIGIDINDHKTIELMKRLAETKLPILSCSGLAFPEGKLNKVPSKLRHTIETQNLMKFYDLLNKVPDLNLIFGHAGIYQTDIVIDLMKAFPNTYVEISVQPPEKIARLIQSVGSERILYGTDYPAFNHAFSIVSVLRADHDDTVRQNIFSANAKKLLNIENT